MSAKEWALLEKTVTTLEPFEEFTRKISSATVSLPVIHFLLFITFTDSSVKLDPVPLQVQTSCAWIVLLDAQLLTVFTVNLLNFYLKYLTFDNLQHKQEFTDQMQFLFFL